MADREKVIKGLESCQKKRITGVACLECPYAKADGEIDGWCVRGLYHDALDLLKEQEPVSPIYENYWKHTTGRCGHCKAPLPALEGMQSKFCWMCGRKVKWDDK